MDEQLSVVVTAAIRALNEISGWTGNQYGKFELVWKHRHVEIILKAHINEVNHGKRPDIKVYGKQITALCNRARGGYIVYRT